MNFIVKHMLWLNTNYLQKPMDKFGTVQNFFNIVDQWIENLEMFQPCFLKNIRL